MARSRRGRGEGSVFQRADGKWCGSVSLGVSASGSRVRKTVYGDTKAKVQQKIRVMQSRFDTGQLLQDEPTLGEWLQHWLRVTEASVGPGTLATYRSHINTHLLPRPIAKVKLSRIRPTTIEGLYALLMEDGVSPSLTRKIGTTLTVAMNHAVRSKTLVSNPCTGVRKPKAPKAKIEVLTIEQAAKLRAACDDARLGAMFVLMLDGGLGPGEVFALHWRDIDVKNRTVRVRQSLEELNGSRRLKDPKTGSRVRTVEISSTTATALKQHRERMQAEGWDTETGLAFVDTEGKALRRSNVHRRDWQPLLKRAKLPEVSLYALRHSCATFLLLAGVNPKIVSERLGHSTISMTLNTYSHVLPTMQREAADIMGKLLSGGG